MTFQQFLEEQQVDDALLRSTGEDNWVRAWQDAEKKREAVRKGIGWPREMYYRIRESWYVLRHGVDR